MPTTHPDIVTDRLTVRSTRVVEANSYQVGDLLSHGAAGWFHASNDDPYARAVGFVVAANEGSFRVVTSSNQIVPWAEHGVGNPGDRLFLGTGGGYLSSRPLGPATSVQEVAEVYDADHLLLFPPDVERPREILRVSIFLDQLLSSPGAPSPIIWTVLEENVGFAFAAPSALLTIPVNGAYIVSFTYKIKDPSPSLNKVHLATLTLNFFTTLQVSQAVEFQSNVVTYAGSFAQGDVLTTNVTSSEPFSDPDEILGAYTNAFLVRTL